MNKIAVILMIIALIGILFTSPWLFASDKPNTKPSSHDPFSSLISTPSSKATTLQKPSQTASENTPPLPEKTNQGPSSLKTILTGVVFTSEGNYALIRIGKTRYVIKEGEYLGNQQLVSVQEKQVLLQSSTGQEILTLTP